MVFQWYISMVNGVSMVETVWSMAFQWYISMVNGVSMVETGKW